MPDQDYTQDKGFMAASPEDQHAYLMSADKGYASASADDQKAFLAHLRGSAPAGISASTPGAMQQKRGGPIVPATALQSFKEGEQKRAEQSKAEAHEEELADKLHTGTPTVGAIKGLENTGRTLGGLGIKAVKYLAPQFGNKLESAWPEATGERTEEMKPQSLASKIGFGGEQAAEFMVPGGAVTKGTKLAEGAIDAAKIAPVAKTAMKLLSRGGLEAASAGGVTAAQGGDVKTNAAIAGMLPFVSAALKKPAEALAEKAAPALANKVLRPVPTQLENAARFGRNPGQAIADEGIIATSHGDLVNRIAERKEDVGRRIGAMLQGAPGAFPNAPSMLKIDAGGIINKNIDATIKDVLDGKVEGGQALVDRLEEMRSQLTQQRQLVNGKVQNLSPKNLNLSPAEAHALKRQVGDTTKWSEDTITQAANDVKRNIYRDLNEEIQKKVPGVKDLQDRYGNLLEAERSAEREYARHQARNPFGLLDYISGGAGAAIGAAHGGTPEAAFLGLALPAARKVLQSPLSQTLGVQGLKNTPKAISPEFLRFVRNAAFGAQSENRQ